MPKILTNKAWRSTFATLLTLASTSAASLLSPQASTACPSEWQGIDCNPTNQNIRQAQIYLVPSGGHFVARRPAALGGSPRYSRGYPQGFSQCYSPRISNGSPRLTYGSPDVYPVPNIPQLERFAQSGSDYLDSIAEGGLLRWDEDRLPLKVFISDGSAVPGFRNSFNKIVTRAFDAWATASGGKLAWREVTSQRDADVVLTWTPKLDGPENSPEAGRTSTKIRLNRATGIGVIDAAHIEIQTLINRQQVPDEEMWRIVLHEVGHAYGLQGHSPSNGDIMYRSVNPHQNPQLSSRDVATINHLYAGYPMQNNIAMHRGQ